MRLLLNAHSRIGVPKEMAYFERCAIAGALYTWQNPKFKKGDYADFVRAFLKRRQIALEGVDVEALDDGDEELKTDRLVVNLGPHHPSTHGVFRMVVTLNGETIETLEPVMGYLHRNLKSIDKLAQHTAP